MNSPLSRLICRATLLAAGFMLCLQAAFAQDLDEVRKRGVLRHLGVPYANFVTGSGDGFDVELMQGFARELGVRYEFVQSNWNDVIGDLTGKEIRYKPSVQEIGSRPVRGDVIANGMTILPPRLKLLDFSEPHLPVGGLAARPPRRGRHPDQAQRQPGAGHQGHQGPHGRRHDLRDGQLLPRPDPLRS